MEQPHRCFECGCPLGNYWTAIAYMKEVLALADSDNNNTHIDKKIIDPDQNDSILPIYQFLNIDIYCCRTHILGETTMRKVGI
jgi:DNA-directed RNA polymerase subunit N (RpoN/RPB10)